MKVFKCLVINDIPKVAFLIPSPLVAPAGTRNRFAKATSGMSCSGHCYLQSVPNGFDMVLVQFCVPRCIADGGCRETCDIAGLVTQHGLVARLPLW